MERYVEETKVQRPPPVHVMTDRKELENVEYFKYLGGMITNDARCTGEHISRIPMKNAEFNKKKTDLINKLNLCLRKKLVKCYIWSIGLYSAEIWTFRKVNQK
jgi:hypothetical protein